MSGVVAPPVAELLFDRRTLLIWVDLLWRAVSAASYYRSTRLRRTLYFLASNVENGSKKALLLPVF